jgi:hypothetical protein
MCVYMCSLYNDWLRDGQLRGRSSSPSGSKIFLLSLSSRPVLMAAQPFIQCVWGAVSPGDKAARECS